MATFRNIDDVLWKEAGCVILDCLEVGFKQLLRLVDAQLVHAGDRGFARGLPESSAEVTRTHAAALRQLFHSEAHVEVFVDVFLCAPDLVIVVFLVEQRCAEAGLPGARSIDQKRAAALLRDLVTGQPFDQVQAQVESRIYATAAEDVVGFGDE